MIWNWSTLSQHKTLDLALDFWLQADMNLIFQMRYFTLLQVKTLQKNQRSKLEVEKKSADHPGPGVSVSNQAESVIYFFASNFCSLLTYKDIQYPIWKI